MASGPAALSSLSPNGDANSRAVSLGQGSDHFRAGLTCPIEYMLGSENFPGRGRRLWNSRVNAY